MNEKELFHELLRRACTTKPSNQSVEQQQEADLETEAQPSDGCSETRTHLHKSEGT